MNRCFCIIYIKNIFLQVVSQTAILAYLFKKCHIKKDNQGLIWHFFPCILKSLGVIPVFFLKLTDKIGIFQM